MPKGDLLKCQKDLDYIDTKNTTKNTTENKKINKKNLTLVDELEKETELTGKAKEILSDFIEYRKNIKNQSRLFTAIKNFSK